MKKFLLACFAFLLLTVPVHAASLADTPNVTVTGHAEMAAVPDTAFISAGIVSLAADVAAAKAENDRLMNNLLTAVTALGIAKEDVRTAGFSVQPQYKQGPKYEELSVITGYRVQNTVTVTVNDFALISPVIDACTQAGANQISGLRFAVRDEAKLKDQLLEKAVLDGKNRAARMAEALGVTLGRPLSVQFTGYTQPAYYDNVRLAKAEFSSSTPVSAGTTTLAVDVNMSFQLN